MPSVTRQTPLLGFITLQTRYRPLDPVTLLYCSVDSVTRHRNVEALVVEKDCDPARTLILNRAVVNAAQPIPYFLAHWLTRRHLFCRSGALCCVSSDTAFFVLKCDKDAVTLYLEQGVNEEDGCEAAFEPLYEVRSHPPQCSIRVAYGLDPTPYSAYDIDSTPSSIRLRPFTLQGIRLRPYTVP